jgi:ribosomal-protein-alanine N-acetyltransferase
MGRMASSRVVLRAPTLADEEEFTSRMRRSRRHHGSWISMPVTHAAYVTYVERNAHDNVELFIACRREDGAIVGFFNISQIVRGPMRGAFLGYGGVADFAGQGYMTEGMWQLLATAFGPLGLHRLEANIQPGNAASIALARRCGFECEGFSPRYLKIGGRWRDHERWAIRTETWRAARRRMVPATDRSEQP